MKHWTNIDYIVLEHSGHSLQNNNKQFKQYYEEIEEYLEKYMAEQNPAIQTITHQLLHLAIMI